MPATIRDTGSHFCHHRLPVPRLHTPNKEESALLPAFETMEMSHVVVPHTSDQLQAALADLLAANAVGFDTESKPIFHRDTVDTGPHVVQLSTLNTAYIFQLHHAACLPVVAEVLQNAAVVKVGFGLEIEKSQLSGRLGIDLRNVLDLDSLFRQQGYERSTGIRAAVAIVFGQSFRKSKKISVTNWAAPVLSESQLRYAANDAYVALRVYEALRARQQHVLVPVEKRSAESSCNPHNANPAGTKRRPRRSTQAGAPPALPKP